MAELDFPADVGRPSARGPRLWRRLWLIALVCAAAGLGLYRFWASIRSRSLAELTAEFGQSTACEFRASETTVSCRGVTITDDLARTIASVRTISSVSLSDCRISSDGWKSITALPDLTIFSAAGCKLSGSVPIRFGSSQFLARVAISGTKLAGSNLAEFLSEQPRLESLLLENTEITDTDLKGWTPSAELYHVSIHEPRLTGAGLAPLSRCRRLESLSLKATGADDDGLAVVGRFGSLRSLDLAACPALDGSGLAHIARLNGLASLDLSGTQVTDRGLESLARGFPALSQVHLTNCGRLTDAVFQSLAHLPRVMMLDLSGTKVTGRGLKFLAGHHSLSTLILSGTQCDDEGLGTLGTLPALTTLDLSQTRIVGGTLARLQGCPRLESLSIAGCVVSRQAVANLSSATPSLRSLDCSNCTAVDDETIESLNGLPHLQTIECRGTHVSEWWNPSRGGLRVRGSNSERTVVSHAEIDEAAALDLGASGRLGDLELDQCRLSAGALAIATSSPSLRAVSLADCTILGGKPGHLGALERLASLAIRNTAVDPADVARVCSGRRVLDLALDGSVIKPGALSTWTAGPSIQKVELKGVNFGGSDLMGFSKCSSLLWLDLNDSDANDYVLESVRKLNGLDTIKLAGCKQVTDEGVRSLVELSRLRCLNLNGTGVTDEGLEPLSRVVRLQRIELSKTNVDGHGLAYLTNCKWLIQLDLAGTKLTDNSIAGVSFPPLLKDLSVANTAIRGSGLGGLCKLSDLRFLNLSGSNVDDDGLQRIAGIWTLWRLDLSHCSKITDAGVRQLAKLSNLTELDLRGTKTSDAALAALATIPKLQTLKLRETLVTKRGIEQFFPSLKTLEADEANRPKSLASEFSRTPFVPLDPFNAK